ncbi:unnamed protein product [Thlaspi arvense]|uniref:Strictosidine synthase conserved region domain-containing protein n=1 Tax=Thlaspi arvense TaxID=13288 RepID=A0AAU9SHV2_THLAR|nr:unnamed protein product [Thlaspi arvense]
MTKVPTWAAVPVVFAVLAVISYQIIIPPDNLEGTKNVLSMAKTIPLPVDGPESIAWDPQGGGPYAAVVDGRILKWRGDDLGWVEFAYTSPHRGNCSRHEVVPTCGRPLGLSFEKKTGDLYICDGYLGVLKVGPEGGLAELVVDQAEGRKVTFANQMDIDEEEDLFYFNDSSDKYHFREVFYVVTNGERSGRVIRYDKKTKEAKVVMDNLRCNNGLALNKDRSFLISCESSTGLVHRYWIKGPKAGTRDIFAKVPGYPDNIRLTPTGDFWLGIHCKKNLLGKLIVNNRWLGKLVEKTVKLDLLIGLMNGFKPHGIAVKISGETGEILEILEDKEGKTMQYVSEADERPDGKLWFASVFTPALWVLDRKMSKMSIIGQKIPKWVVVSAVLAAVAIIMYKIFLAPDHLRGSKNILSMAKTIPLPVDGPESIEWDPKGEGPYAAVVDGRILKWRGHGLGWVEFAYTSPLRGNCSRHGVVPTCGRPLGLSFEKKTGDLYICDGYLGVMNVGPEGGLAKLVVGEADGRKVTFANQMDIDEEEDVLYFNDSSDKYHFREVFYVIFNGERSGRVVRYNKKTKEARVVMDNLRCNNGLALNKDRSFLISCESSTGLVHRYWIKGPKAGTRDIFAKVPGYPDNIRLTPTGDFWLGIHCKKNLIGRLIVNNRWLGKLVEKTVKLKFLIGLMNGFKPHGIAVRISGETGEILEILEDKEGKTMQYVSEAYERPDGKLWFGSVFTPAVWVLDRK